MTVAPEAAEAALIRFGLMNFPLDGLGYATRHDGGSNVCLLDGHVRRYPYEKLIALDLEEALGDTPCDP